MTAATAVAESDLHAFVDGLLEPQRRADFLRRLSASPADRARVDAWQDQNELIRMSFADVEHEALPPVLDLVPPGAVHRLPGPSAASRSTAGRGRVATVLATTLLIGATLTGVWLLLPSDDVRVAGDPGLRGPLDATLASRTMQALAGDIQARAADKTQGAPTTLPTGAIPDLSAAGFALTRAESAGTPASLVLHYENGDAERLVISVARSATQPSTRPKKIGRAYNWHRNDTAFAIAGTVKPDRLLTIAMSLQDAAPDN